MRTFLKLTALLIAFTSFGGGVFAQVASPLQPGHYVPGIIGIRDMATPPPGIFAILYNWYLWSNTYVDRNGNELTKFNLSNYDPMLPDVNVDMKLNGFATVPVIAWASEFTILGGARYIAAIAPNYAVANYDILLDPEIQGVDPIRQEGSVSGFSDLVVLPLGLSWAFGEFDDLTVTDEELAALGLSPRRRHNVTVMYSFLAPTGRYEAGASDNIGLGFWTHQFQGFGYYFPFEHQATALMAGLTFELNSETKDVKVTPGNRLSLEWGVSQFFTEWLELQIGGAHNWQVSDDTGDDVLYDPSVYDRKNTIYFGAAFMPVLARFYIVAKYGFDFGLKQRFQNNNLVLSIYWATGLLSGK